MQAGLKSFLINLQKQAFISGTSYFIYPYGKEKRELFEIRLHLMHWPQVITYCFTHSANVFSVCFFLAFYSFRGKISQFPFCFLSPRFPIRHPVFITKPSLRLYCTISIPVSHSDQQVRREENSGRKKDYINETNLYGLLKKIIHIVGSFLLIKRRLGTELLF